ncbi:MAG: zinc metallopeptidase [Spirochaetaceae bacterium]|jgi:Zn-dependent membrane protease YugP|nr:zinc metallopeptidase [Spirochaetaceae bacterium]
MMDLYYVILVIPAILLSLYAQILVKSTFAKYSRIKSSRNISGREVAALLMRAQCIQAVAIQRVSGALTDHYDPGAKVLRLSEPVYGDTSIAAIGVAAHETGHAMQHAFSYGPLALRSALVPAANIGSAVGPWLAIGGFFLSIPFLINLGIIFFGVSVLFYLITLPVEFDASSRALEILRANHILNESELEGVKKVLSAAALTYVAAALTALMNFLRLILLARDRQR